MEKSNPIEIENNLLKGEDFIVFGEDFSRHPHALEHLLRPLFENNRFLWVETIGLRTPKLNFYDLKRIIEKLSVWFQRPKTTNPKKQPPKNIIILSPFMIPFNQFTIVRQFNQWTVTRSVKRAMVKHNINSPLSIASVPNACDYIGEFGEKLKIYFCVDEFSLWPGLDKKMVENFENKLIEKVDIIAATSDTLAMAKTKKGVSTPVITHGVEFEHFNIGPKKIKTEHFKICYFGLFDDRTDQNILLSISTSIQNCEIHIFGNTVCNLKKLKECKNIFFHGPIDYQDLPSAIADMDIFILPYLKNELTNFINPLKLKEYLSTGRPVIASDLPEVIKLKNFLLTGQTPQDFVDIIQKLINQEILFEGEKILTYVKHHETWKAKALILSSLIRKSI